MESVPKSGITSSGDTMFPKLFDMCLPSGPATIPFIIASEKGAFPVNSLHRNKV